MIVAKQRANPNKDIARLASEIVSKWRKTVEAEKAKKLKITASSPPKNGAASSPAPQAEIKGFVGDSSKRRWETDKVDTKRTGIPSRDACVGLIYNGLCFMSHESSASIIVKAMEVEQAAFDTFKGDNTDYRSKLRSLFQNLKTVSNRELGQRVMSGEITPSQFVVMSQDELKSADRRKADEKLNKENLLKAQVPTEDKSVSDALKCGRCGQKKVSYTQAQTRSADEPMTTFCECTVCGNRWKVCIFFILFLYVRPNNLYSSREALKPLTVTRAKHFFSWYTFMDGLRGSGFDLAVAPACSPTARLMTMERANKVYGFIPQQNLQFRNYVLRFPL